MNIKTRRRSSPERIAFHRKYVIPNWKTNLKLMQRFDGWTLAYHWQEVLDQLAAVRLGWSK